MQKEEVLIRPIITEKITTQTDHQNKYGFQVALKASKFQIKEAVEKLYDVKVVGVNTSVLPGSVKRAGKHLKKSAKIKKAIVELKSGQKIEFFKGV